MCIFISQFSCKNSNQQFNKYDFGYARGIFNQRTWWNRCEGEIRNINIIRNLHVHEIKNVCIVIKFIRFMYLMNLRKSCLFTG